MSLFIDTLQDTEYQSNRGNVRIVRGAKVTGLDQNAPYAVMTAALLAAGMPQVNQAHPTVPACACIGHEIRFDHGAGNIARLRVIYETPKIANGATINQFQVRFSSSVATTKTNYNLVNGELLYARKNDPKAGGPITRYVSANMYRPIQNLTASGVFTKPIPNTTIQQALLHVNNATWNDYDAGYWLCSNIEQYTTDNGNTWNVSVAFMNLVIEDWSTFLFMQDENGNVDLLPNINIDYQTLKEQTYQNKSYYALSGVTKTGLYPLASFNQLFPNITSRNQPAVQK